MRYLYLLLAFVGIQTLVFAQKELKYKTIFPQVLSDPPSVSYPLLLQYQRQDPTHANVYYQLGVIAQKWSIEYDPLTEPRDVNFFTYHTNVYLGLCKKYVTDYGDKEARRNRELYQFVLPQSEKIEVTDILSDLQTRIDSNDVYQKTVESLTFSFNKSVDYYNFCVESFKSINRDYAKIKDIYLMADDELIARMDSLSDAFDSTLFYFDKYRTTLSGYSIHTYDQQYALKPITTFRLDGLTSSNFLNNEIKLWNYGAWVDEVYAMLSQDVQVLREMVAQEERNMDATLQYFDRTPGYSDQIQAYALPKEVVFMLGKFDHQSLMLDFLRYREAQLGLLTMSRNTVNNPNDSNQVNVLRQTKFVTDFVQQKLLADSLNKQLTSHLTEDGVSKYTEIFATKYNGYGGIIRFADNQTKQDNALLTSVFNNVKTSVIKEATLFTEQKDSMLSYGKAKIPFYVQVPEPPTASDGQFVTVQIAPDARGNKYLVGYTKQGSSPTAAFIAYADGANTIKWVKQYALNTDANDAAMLVQVTENGCISIINSTKSEGLANTLVAVDSTGKEKAKFPVNSAFMPRCLQYDDINGTVLTAFKGTMYDQTNSTFSELQIQQTTLKDSLIWSQKLYFAGQLADIVKMDQNYIVVANYSEYIDSNKKNVVSKAGNTPATQNVFSTLLDAKGQIIQQNTYNSTSPFFAIRVVKVSSEQVAILNTGGAFKPTSQLDKKKSSDLIFFLVNKDGSLNYSSINQ